MNSQAKERVSRRASARKRDRIRKYADLHGLTYSEAEERLLDRGLSAENPLGPPLPREVAALFWGTDENGAPAEPGRSRSVFTSWDELVACWDQWRVQIEPPHSSWWANHRVDDCSSAAEAIERSEAARTARVTEQTGTSWVERHKSGECFAFWTYDNDEGSSK